VAVALVLVLMLLSYQESFQEWRLFPLRRRWNSDSNNQQCVIDRSG
jgi:hypothetical protein